MTGKKKSPPKSSVHGLYRRSARDQRTGKWKPVGAYILDMRIPEPLWPEFAGIKRRIMKSTEVFPETKNAETIVAEMRMMVKDIFRQRDAKTLKRIQKDKLSLASAYAKWKSGRLHLAEQYEDTKVVKAWLEYLDKAVLAPKTKANRRAVVAALIKHGLLSEEDVLADLPECLEQWREHYQKLKQNSAFNTYRGELLSFLTKGLGFDDESRLLHAVARVKPLKQQKRKPHHPLESPRDLLAFCDAIQRRPTPEAKSYADSVLFMCLHGLRPDEFASKRFRIDPKTGHLKIDGTKNENADRIAPLLQDVESVPQPPRIDTLNRMFERMEVETRCRDFRRTYAVWCEKAGLVASNIRAYMGHGDASVTQTYQRIIPKRETLDHDAELLRKWMDAELKKPASQSTKQSLMSAFRFKLSAVSLSREELLKRMNAQKAIDARINAKYRPGRESKRASRTSGRG